MNRIIKLVIILIIGTIASNTYSQSNLVDTKFFSASLDTIRDLRIYLPDGYDSTDIDKRYSVIYFLHGSGGNQTSYSGIFPILDSLITNHVIMPVIVVIPDGSSGPYLGSNYSNSALYGLFENYIAFDLIDYIDSNYKTIPSKDNRAIMGHSMGGEGSMRIALKHPNLYSGVASHSGVLSNGFLDFIVPLVIAEMDSTNQIKPTNGYMSQALFTAAGGTTPNMNNPPFYVDLPIDNHGNLIDSTFAKWQKTSTVFLATKYNTESNLQFYFDCGTDDPIFYYTTIFADTLKSRNIPFEFQSFKGGHSDKFYERFKISVVFLSSVIAASDL
jgi:S-formylglutathione hydrolase FrmB